MLLTIYADCVLMLQVLDDPSEDNLHMGMHVFVLCVQILLLCSCPVSVSLWHSMRMAPTSVRVIYSEMVVSLQTCLGLARYAEALHQQCRSQAVE